MARSPVESKQTGTEGVFVWLFLHDANMNNYLISILMGMHIFCHVPRHVCVSMYFELLCPESMLLSYVGMLGVNLFMINVNLSIIHLSYVARIRTWVQTPDTRILKKWGHEHVRRHYKN